MSVEFNTLRDVAAHGFDELIDVRSPAEFAEDHMPGAISLPVLDDEERARVGTIYVQDSPFRARKVGAAVVARNAARHIETALAEKGGGWRPLIYCWRGGQRSGSFASILSQIGWRADTVAGGYRSFRRMVVRALYDAQIAAPFVVLDGNTGSAKTEVLARLADAGVQVLDLEGLARHRGSVLGPVAEAQPSQKAFETGIAMVLAQTDAARPVVVEAESSKVGERMVPPSVWTAMQAAPRIVIDAPVAARAAYLARAYQDVTRNADAFGARLDLLIPFHGHNQVAEWREMLTSGAHEQLAADLIERHYDPRYAKSRGRSDRLIRSRVTVEALDDDGIEQLSVEVGALLSDAAMVAE